MTTRLHALFLLVGAFAICFGIRGVQDRHMPLLKPFRFAPPGYWGGPPLHGGCFTDVICSQRLPNGEPEARIVVERVLMIDVKQVMTNGRTMQHMTLQVTPSQATILQEAQNAGTLHHSLCRSVESKSLIDEVCDCLLGPRRLTEADLCDWE